MEHLGYVQIDTINVIERCHTGTHFVCPAKLAADRRLGNGQCGHAMVEWKPISKTALLARIEQGQARMSPAERRLWEAIRIEPEKWQQHPYGDQGAGFWVVALAGRTVIWYNDIEEGFNRSRYSTYGTIDDYWCNQDELELTLRFLLSTLEQGSDLLRFVKPPAKVPR